MNNKVTPLSSSSYSDPHYQIPPGLVAKLKESLSLSIHSSEYSSRPSSSLSASPIEDSLKERTREIGKGNKAKVLLDACQSSSKSETMMTTHFHFEDSLRESSESFHSIYSKPEQKKMDSSLTESLSSREQVGEEKEKREDRDANEASLFSSLNVAETTSSLSSLPSSPVIDSMDARSDLVSWIIDRLDSEPDLDANLSCFVDQMESHPLFKSLLSLELKQRTGRGSPRKKTTATTTYLHAQLSPQLYHWIMKKYKATCPELVILLDLEEAGLEDGSEEEDNSDDIDDSPEVERGSFHSRSMDGLLSPCSESESDSFIEAYQTGQSSLVPSCHAAVTEPSSLTLDALLHMILFDGISSCPMSVLDFISTFDYYMNSFDLLKSICLSWMIYCMTNDREVTDGKAKERLYEILKLWMQERPLHFYDSLEVLQLLFYFLQVVHDDQTRGLGGKALASLQGLISHLSCALRRVHVWRQCPHSVEYWRKKSEASLKQKASEHGPRQESKGIDHCHLSMLQFTADRETYSDSVVLEDESSGHSQNGAVIRGASESMEKRDALRVLSSLSLDEFVDYFATQAQGQSLRSIPKSWLMRSMMPRTVAQYLGQMEWCRYERLRSWTFYQQAWLFPPSLMLLLSSSSTSFSQVSGGLMGTGVHDWLTSGVLDVQYIIDWFNRMTCGIASHILTTTTLAERRVALAFWIRVGEAATALGQYQLAFQVAAALSSGPLVRSTKLWKNMDRKTSDMHAALMTLANPVDRYSSYRQHLKQRVIAVKAHQQSGASMVSRDPLVNEAWPTLPFLGVLLSDLTFAEDGNPTTLSKPSFETEEASLEPEFGSKTSLDHGRDEDASFLIRFYSLYSNNTQLNIVKLKMVTKIVQDFFEPLTLNRSSLSDDMSSDVNVLFHSQSLFSSSLLQTWQDIGQYFSHHFPCETEQSLYQLSYKWEPPFYKKETT